MATVTYEVADTALAARLSPTALAHSRNVARTAAELAARYGVDTELARLSGLLHDWDREKPREELVSSAVDAGLEITPADAAVPYLLHARTGACALREAFPELPQAVVDAVAHHTVGSAEMSDLDKVVYVADMIEPGRAYEGVEELRAIAATCSLEELFVSAYQASVAYLVRSRKRIHPQTVAVWNALVAGDPR